MERNYDDRHDVGIERSDSARADRQGRARMARQDRVHIVMAAHDQSSGSPTER
jgi:hypothetical protein